MALTSPLPSSSELLDAAHELLRRAAAADSPRERLRCVLAVCNAAGAAELPVTVRCHAHQMAGALLHEYTLEQGQAVQHLRTALH